MIDVPNIFNVYDRFVDLCYAVDFTNHPTLSHTGFELRDTEPIELVTVDGEKKPFRILNYLQYHNDMWNFGALILSGIRQ